MLNTELLRFIQAEIVQGKSQQIIFDELQAQGWNHADLEHAFSVVASLPVDHRSVAAQVAESSVTAGASQEIPAQLQPGLPQTHLGMASTTVVTPVTQISTTSTPVHNLTEPVVPPAPYDDVSPANLFDFRKMKSYEWFALVPLGILIVTGGALGAGLGVAGIVLVLWSLRRHSYSGATKAFLGITIVCSIYLVFFLLAETVGTVTTE